MGDVVRELPRIYAAVDNLQKDHQASIIEMEGKLYD